MLNQRGNFKEMKDSMHKRDKETQERLDFVFNLQSNALKQKLLYKQYSFGELPFSSLNEIQIHENELATATTFNVSFQHLLDNDLYLENVYYEKEYSDSGVEYLAIKGLDNVDDISSKDRATMLASRAKMVLGISPGAAAFFTLVPKNDSFFYESYGNTIDGSYDFATMYRSRRLLKLDANTVYVQKPKDTSENREFVKLAELVNLTGIYSVKSLPDFDESTIVNDLISNEFNGRIMVDIGNNSVWRVLNNATSFILTDNGLFAMNPDNDSLVKIEFSNTQGIDKWVLGGFHSIAGEPTLILVAKDNSERTRVFYVSIEAYPLLFDGNTIREMIGVDIDGVNDSPIADIQQLIPYVDGTLATFTSGGFLQFNSFKYGFPEKAKEFLTGDTRTDVPNLHRFDSVAKMDMPFIGSLASGDVQRVSIDSLDRTTIGHDFINSSSNLGNGALYWYPDGNKVKAKKFGTTDIKDSLFWDVSPAGSGISVSKDELVAVSTKLLMFLKSEEDSDAKTLYGFIRKGEEYKYQAAGQDWGWGIISDNGGRDKFSVGSVFNTYNCTFFPNCEEILSTWFDIDRVNVEDKILECSAYTEFKNAINNLSTDSISMLLKYERNTSDWTLDKFAATENDRSNVLNFRNFIQGLKTTVDPSHPEWTSVEAFVDSRWNSASSRPTAGAYNFIDQMESAASQLTGMFVGKVNGEIGKSNFFDMVKLDVDSFPTIAKDDVVLTQSLSDTDVEREAKSMMASLLNGISFQEFTVNPITSTVWKNEIASNVVNTTTYFDEWERYAIGHAEYEYGNASSDSNPPTYSSSVKSSYDGLAPKTRRNVVPSVRVGFRFPDGSFNNDLGDVRFSGTWSVVEGKRRFVANSIDAAGGSSVSFTVIRDGTEDKITDISYVHDNILDMAEFSVTFTVVSKKGNLTFSRPKTEENEVVFSKILKIFNMAYGTGSGAPDISMNFIERTCGDEDSKDITQDYLAWIENGGSESSDDIDFEYYLLDEGGYSDDGLTKPDIELDIPGSTSTATTVSFPVRLFAANREDADDGDQVGIETEFRLSIVDYYGKPVLNGASAKFESSSDTPNPQVKKIRSFMENPQSGSEQIDTIIISNNEDISATGNSLLVEMKWYMKNTLSSERSVPRTEKRTFQLNDSYDGIDYMEILSGKTFSYHNENGVPINKSGNMTFELGCSPAISGIGGANLVVGFAEQKLTKIFESDFERRKLAISSMSKYNAYRLLLNYRADDLTIPTYDEPTPAFVAPTMDNIAKQDSEDASFGGLLYKYDTLTGENSLYSLTEAHQTADGYVPDKYTISGTLSFKMQVNAEVYYYYKPSESTENAKSLQNEQAIVTATIPFKVEFYADIEDGQYKITGNSPSVSLDWDKSSVRNSLKDKFHLLNLDTATTYYLDKCIKQDDYIFIVSSQLMDEQGLSLKQMPVFAINHGSNNWKLGKYNGDDLLTSEETFKGGSSVDSFAFDESNWQITPITPSENEFVWEDPEFQFNTILDRSSTLASGKAKYRQNRINFFGLNREFSKTQYNGNIKTRIDNFILLSCNVISNLPDGEDPVSDDDILTMFLGPQNSDNCVRTITYSDSTTRLNRTNAPLSKIIKSFGQNPTSILSNKGHLDLGEVRNLSSDAFYGGKICFGFTILRKVNFNIESDYAGFSQYVSELGNHYKFSNPYQIGSVYARSHNDEFNRINNTLNEMTFSSGKNILPVELLINSDASVPASAKPSVNLVFVNLYDNLKSHLNKALSASLYYPSKVSDGSFFMGVDQILHSLPLISTVSDIHQSTMNLALQKINSVHTRNFVKFDFVENQVPERMYCIKANNEIKKDTGVSDIDTQDDAKIFGVVGRKAMSFTESSLCGVISDARIFTEKQVFTPVPYEVKTFPYDIERWEPANTSCTAMVYWLKVPYQEGDRQPTDEYGLTDGIYAYMDDDGIVGFLDAVDSSDDRHTITNVAYTPSIGKVFFTVSDSNDVYATDASAMKLKRDRVHKINLSVDCDMFKTRYSGNPNLRISSMFLSDRDEALRSEGTFDGKFNLVVQFDDNSLHRFTFTKKMEFIPYSPVALSNAFSDENLSAAYRHFSGATINDISKTDFGLAAFAGNTYYIFEDGYARKEDAVLYPTLLKSFDTADSVYTSYYLDSNLVITCINTSGPLQEMYPYHQISLPEMIPELRSIADDNLIVYDVDMTSWSSESTVSYIIVYTNKGVYLVDMGVSPGRLKYDDKQAVIDYFVERSTDGIDAHLTSKHHDKTILSRFNNWRRRISDNKVYDFASLTTNTEFTSPTERHGGRNDNPKISVIVDKQVFGGGTVICSADENPGVVFAAIQSPITKYDQTWKKAQLASPLIDTQFYDYFYRSDTAPNGATLLSGMLNLNHLPFIYRFNTDKTWDMWVNIPSTMTPYMSRVVGSSANIKGGRVKVEGNLAKMRKNINNVGVISDPLEQATVVRLYINTGHFHMDSITDAVISGSSLPMHVYRDSDANDGLFDGVQMQSVWNRRVETVTDKHGIAYAMLEFKVWGADEQSVMLHGALAEKMDE